MGERGLAERLKVSQEEAYSFISRYFTAYPGIKAFVSRTKQQATERGLVTTISGRIRPLPEIRSSSSWRVARAERQAVNTVIQGSAADIIKKAMVNIFRNKTIKREGVKMILQAHDELLFEIRKDLVNEVTAEIIKEMQTAWVLHVPLVAEATIGANWGNMKALTFTKTIPQREVHHDVLRLMREIEKEFGTAKLSEILALAVKEGIEKEAVINTIVELKERGRIFEPKFEEYREV